MKLDKYTFQIISMYLIYTAIAILTVVAYIHLT